MAQECLDRVQASLCEDLQWNQSDTRTAPSSPCMFLASTPAVTSIGPSPSSGSHHEETWLGLGPPDVSPVYRKGAPPLWPRGPEEATGILQACVVAWPGVAWHGGVQAEGSNPKPKPKCLDFSEHTLLMVPPNARPLALKLCYSTDSSSSDDTTTTVSLQESDLADDPEQVWDNLGLVAPDTPMQPYRRRRLNTPGTEASSHFCSNRERLSISCGCHTPLRV